MKMQTTNLRTFDLRETLYSGQIFRFEEVDDGFWVRVGSSILRIEQHGDTLRYGGCDRAFVRKYLALDEDLASLPRAIENDEILRPALHEFPGLRVLRQEPWECLVSFICSSASNIPRIKRKIDALCRLFGFPIEFGGYQSRSFPRAGELTDEAAMRREGLGYRARFLAELNEVAPSLDLESLRNASYDDAKSALVELPGVGEKIADCVLLFSLDFSEAFPVDVWIKRAVQDWYFGGRKIPDRDIRQFASDRWGEHAGYAQQYIYHYARMRARNG
jgi:N-glycosylase/DNA lyase